jgi:ComF family protein
MFEQLFSIIAPHQCLDCGQEGTLLCRTCQDALPPPPLHCCRCGSASCQSCAAVPGRVFAATEYTGVAKELIHKLKFERARAGAEHIAQVLARRLPAFVGDDVVVSFVPTAPKRVRIRGYDQAALIAHRVSALRKIPCLPLLARNGQQRQVGKSRAVRRKQLQGAFRASQPTIAHTKHVLLIDDVLTTGATLEAAAAVLYDAGARRVDGIVFARA